MKILPFMKFKLAYLLASFVFILSIFYYLYAYKQGIKQGIDFSGGMKIEILKNEVVTMKALQLTFRKNKIIASIQALQSKQHDSFKIELNTKQEILLQKKSQTLAKKLAQYELSTTSIDYLHYLLIKNIQGATKQNIILLSADKVGPTVGTYLKQTSLKLLVIALILIMVYVAFRFHFRFSVGGIVAILHDMLVTVGIISLFDVSINIPIIAALLTILGYSINDTIVIFDRIRENINLEKNVINIDLLIEKSIYQSFSRTFITSFTTLIALLAIFLLGGEILKDMAFTLIIGIIVGTYSSIYVASPVVALLNKHFK